MSAVTGVDSIAAAVVFVPIEGACFDTILYSVSAADDRQVVILSYRCHPCLVAVATLCYYMQPVIVILVSPLYLGERLTGKKLLCVACAVLGMFLVTGLPGAAGAAGAAGHTPAEHLRGVACGLGNIQKIRDGEPLGGHTNASNDFDAVDDGDEDFLN